jgi:DNA polymerase-3 subunit gamma/tau
VFENIIEQSAVSQLQDDIVCGRRAPSMLFYGPGESGKGSTALELSRVLSCEGDASWKCSCPSCGRHRYLQHDDLLMLGRRAFTAEIYASRSVFMRNPSSLNAKILFFRSLRKLQMRFSPVIMEDDPRFDKVSSVLQSLDEGLNEFLETNTADTAVPEKLVSSLVNSAVTLDCEGFSSTIPIGQIRRAAYWCRLAPAGKRKTLVIEKAENMREEARNSLLKLLEEPPANVCIVLTTQGREKIMPTILSRLRPYRFLKRSAEGEKEVLRRVFQNTVDVKTTEDGGSLISAFLDSFLPGGTEKLYNLAAWFAVSLARTAFSFCGENAARIVNLLEARYAQTAGASGPEFPLKSAGLVRTLLDKSGNFEDDSLSRFLGLCLDFTACAAGETGDPQYIAYSDVLRKHVGETVTAVDVFNQNAALALEALLYKLKKDMRKTETYESVR